MRGPGYSLARYRFARWASNSATVAGRAGGPIHTHATGTSTQPWRMPMHIDWAKGVESGRGEGQLGNQLGRWG